jgi:hypothetical protein
MRVQVPALASAAAAGGPGLAPPLDGGATASTAATGQQLHVPTARPAVDERVVGELLQVRQALRRRCARCCRVRGVWSGEGVRACVRACVACVRAWRAWCALGVACSRKSASMQQCCAHLADEGHRAELS